MRKCISVIVDLVIKSVVKNILMNIQMYQDRVFPNHLMGVLHVKHRYVNTAGTIINIHMKCAQNE